MSVNKDNVRKWVDALRSGRFEQTNGALHKDEGYREGYCCLGVACEVSDLGTWVPAGDETLAYEIVGVEYDEYEPASAYLPPEVQDWLGIDAKNPSLQADPEDLSGSSMRPILAATLNDTYDWTFEQIADAIERTYL